MEFDIRFDRQRRFQANACGKFGYCEFRMQLLSAAKRLLTERSTAVHPVCDMLIGL